MDGRPSVWETAMSKREGQVRGEDSGMPVASVCLLRSSYAIRRPFDYLLPPALADTVGRGSLIEVPFGRGNRPEMAVCVSVFRRQEAEERPLKQVARVLPDAYRLTDEQMDMAEFLRDYTLCTLGEAVYTVAPAAVREGRENLRRVRLLSVIEGAEPHKKPSAAGERILALCRQAGVPLSYEEVMKGASVGRGAIQTLLAAGLLCEQEAVLHRDPYGALRTDEPPEPIVLTTAQTSAYERILALYREKRAAAALLFGVTGSGKTKVILKMIDEVLADGRGVIMMVPEIALTPQTVGIFYRRYGGATAVIHSSLSEGERVDAWRRIASGEARVVIGTRSAVFAPVPDLGLIVLDEEHEHTYKSERDPKYHARDVAAFRAGRHGCPVILASATPSFESYEKALRGTYTLIPLRERFGGAPLPDTKLIDMRAELRAGNRSPLSRALVEALSSTLERGEQAILFLNRRGYSTTLQCRRCGEVVSCPHCSVSLTHHAEGGDRLLCHVCGYKAPLPAFCPACGEAALAHTGFGTERAASEIARLLPSARVLRMDADTTAAKGTFDRMLTAFRAGEADILLGTQMVTKGHDFPRVSLVGVLLADTSLYAEDFRAGERTFSLLAQVIGRAGRADTEGLALVQTFTPENEILSLACAQDYEAFYKKEAALRRAAVFPPFCDTVQLTASATREDLLAAGVKRLFSRMTALAESDYADQPMNVYGPFEAKVYREHDRFRMRIVVKCRLNNRMRTFFRTLLEEFSEERSMALSLDLAPLSI